MKALKFLCIGLIALAAASSSWARPQKPVTPKKHQHALVIVLKAAVATPKFSAVALKDTVGGILFSAEAVIDVVHVGTTALSNAANMELKKNPFEYVDKGVGYVDTGLEKAYLFFFNAQI